MSESTMICETVWDEAPSIVVFKGHSEWGNFVPERTCGEYRGYPRHDAISYWAAHEDDELWCEYCDIELEPDWDFCPKCGAKVVEE